MKASEGRAAAPDNRRVLSKSCPSLVSAHRQRRPSSLPATGNHHLPSPLDSLSFSPPRPPSPRPPSVSKLRVPETTRTYRQIPRSLPWLSCAPSPFNSNPYSRVSQQRPCPTSSTHILPSPTPPHAPKSPNSSSPSQTASFLFLHSTPERELNRLSFQPPRSPLMMQNVGS